MDGDRDEPEWYINTEVLIQTVILIIVRGLGNLLLLWSTVVLLGGFVSDLPMTDFYIITIISVLQSVRVFNALVDVQYQYLLDCLKKHREKMKSAFDLVFLVLIISAVSYPMLVSIAHIVLSGIRVTVYWYKLGDAATDSFKDQCSKDSFKEAKMNKAVLWFYILTLIQGVLYLLWFILEIISYYWLVVKTVKKYNFNDSWGKDYIHRYIASIKSKCLSNLAAERSLIKHASGLLDSDSNTDLLSGAKMVNHFLNKKKLPVQELIRSSRSRVQKLLMMLAWKQAAHDDRVIRLEAAKIVAHVAHDLDIAQFPGTLGCISSLIEPSKDNYSLYRPAQTSDASEENGEEKLHMYERNKGVDECEQIVQGFRILDKLTLNKHNSIEILQDQPLLTHIIAWVRSKPFIGPLAQGNDWPQILESCLNVLVRLTSLPEKSASDLHHMIKVTLPIFITGYASNPKLQVKAIKMFANVFYLDNDKENTTTHQKRQKFLNDIWGLFSTCRQNNREDQVFKGAGEALSMLSSSKKNCHALYSLDAKITEQLDKIMMDQHCSVVYRSLATEISARVWKKTIYYDVTSKVLHEKKLSDVVEEDENGVADFYRKPEELVEVLQKKLENVISQLLQLCPPKKDDNDVEYFYRLQAALVYTINVLITTPVVEQDKEASDEVKRRREKDASSFKDKITTILGKHKFVQELKKLVEEDIEVRETGRLEVVKRTAHLVRSMIKGGFFVENIKSDKIIESLKKANTFLSGHDSWEIFDSNQRRGLKWLDTLESLINDIHKLLNQAENTTCAGTKEKQVIQESVSKSASSEERPKLLGETSTQGGTLADG